MNNKQRYSNFELLRVFSMFMIVTFHMFDWCTRIQLTDTASISSMGNGLFCQPLFYKKLLILSIFAPLGKTGDGIFLLISGFFLAGRDRIDLAKISKKLLSQLMFATITLMVLSVVSIRMFSLGDVTDFYIGTINISYFNGEAWYVGYYYLVIVLASMGLNKLLIRFDQKEYMAFLFVTFSITSFYWTGNMLTDFAAGCRVLGAGVFLYALGGYIKRYDPFDNIRLWVLFFIIIICYLLVFISEYNLTIFNIEKWAQKENAVFIQTIQGFSDYSVIPITLAITIFELFRRLKIKNSRIINYLGASCFMIYLIHCSNFVFTIWRMKDWIKLLYYHPYKYVCLHLLCSGITFIICVLIYCIYLMIFSNCSEPPLRA